MVKIRTYQGRILFSADVIFVYQFGSLRYWCVSYSYFQTEKPFSVTAVRCSEVIHNSRDEIFLTHVNLKPGIIVVPAAMGQALVVTVNSWVATLIWWPTGSFCSYKRAFVDFNLSTQTCWYIWKYCNSFSSVLITVSLHVSSTYIKSKSWRRYEYYNQSSKAAFWKWGFYLLAAACEV